MLKERNIVVWIIISLLTCGIGSLIWFVLITDDIALANKDTKLSGGMCLLYTIITCGIYGIYWYYKRGQELAEAGEKHGTTINDNSVLYLILGIFGFGIIDMCLMQNDLNTLAKLEA